MLSGPDASAAAYIEKAREILGDTLVSLILNETKDGTRVNIEVIDERTPTK